VKLLSRAAVLLLPVVPVSGCGYLQPFFKPKKPEAPEAALPAWIGRVVMVDAIHRFVLVDTGAGAAPSVGAKILTIRDKRKTAVLRATGEARQPYVAMEIVEGEPALGDQAALDESGSVSAPSSPE